MKKIILCTLLIPVISYANNLKIIDQQVEKISYEEFQKIKHVQTKSAMCMASAQPAMGKAGTMVTASGYVNYVINNMSNVSQNYWIDVYMCINGIGCTHSKNTVTLGANLSGNGGYPIATSQYIATKGTYIDQASIQISGESTCFVQGSSTVTVN